MSDLINKRTQVAVYVTRVVFEPGDLTRYEFLVVPIAGLGVPGTRSEHFTEIVMINLSGKHYPFRSGPNAGPLTVEHVGEKLGLSGPSAQAMTVAICRELNREPIGVFENECKNHHTKKYRAAWDEWQKEQRP